MSEPQRRRMTPEEFFAWQERQDRNYELVDGVPVLPLKAMTGATRRHDRAITNALVALSRQLRGGPCWPSTSDIAIRTTVGTVRRPDLTVDCRAAADALMEAQDPRLILEVLSPSTMGFDRIRKVDEYRQHPNVQVIILAETRDPKVGVWRRGADGWSIEEYAGLEAVIPLPEISASLPMAELYEGLTFDTPFDPAADR